MDGVILYNPFRIARAPIDFLDKILSRKKELNFYYPHTHLAQMLWRWAHLSSLFVAPGYSHVKQLINKKIFEGYIVTARYNFLKDDFEKWLIKLGARDQMEACYHNENDDQPHLYKERMINKLGIDIFIEDNWDIVNYLNKRFEKSRKKPKIFWIYNIVDQFIPYSYKFSSLQSAIDYLEREIIKT